MLLDELLNHFVGYCSKLPGLERSNKLGDRAYLFEFSDGETIEVYGTPLDSVVPKSSERDGVKHSWRLREFVIPIGVRSESDRVMALLTCSDGRLIVEARYDERD